MREMNYTCQVCGYSKLEYPPDEFTICPSCGTEFGNDDFEYSHAELRQRWIASGMRWWSENDPIPDGWNPSDHLQHVFSYVEANETTNTKGKDFSTDYHLVKILLSNDVNMSGGIFRAKTGTTTSARYAFATL
jgi:hypothetical protein